MRIGQLILTAFGRFLGQTLHLGPGLNIIYGHNEAGKSTVQRFILGMLYGFKRPAGRREFTDDAARYRPWQGDAYRGALLYTLGSGRTYRVEREFDPHRESVRIYDATTGADLSGQFTMDRRKELLFAEEQMGLPEAVFRSTAWVGQLEVGRLELGRELITRVANLQESGREDLSVKSALRTLEERMREIGTDRAPTKPYARLGRQIEEKRQELARALSAREESMVWESQLHQVGAQIQAVDRELNELQRRIDWAMLREVQDRRRRASAAGGGARAARMRAHELRGFAEFPVHLRERLQRHCAEAAAAREQAKRHGERKAELQAEIEALADRLSQEPGMAAVGILTAAAINSAQEADRAAAAGLPGLREEGGRLKDLIARLEESIQPLRPAADKGAEVLGRIDSIDRDLAALRARLEPSRIDSLRQELPNLERERRATGGWLWLILALLGMGAAAAFSLGLAAALGAEAFDLAMSVGGALVAALALLLFSAARRRAGRIGRMAAGVRAQLESLEAEMGRIYEQTHGLERAKAALLEGIQVATPAEIQSRVIRFEQLSARRDGYRMRLQTVHSEMGRLEGESRQRRQDLERQLASALDLPLEELRADPDPILRFRRAYARYQDGHLRLESLHRERSETARRQEAELDQAVEAEAEARSLLAEVGLQSPEDFYAGCTRREAWQQAHSEAESLEAALGSLLGDETPEALAAQEERLRAAVEGSEPPEEEASAGLQAEARRLQDRRADLNARAEGLGARVETALRGLADTADLNLQLTSLIEERAGLEQELAALTLACTVIGEVTDQMHREFAPKLSCAMGQVLFALTGGKYQAVRIDESMTMRAITGEERTVDLLSLSGGTVDQFYFGLRVALLDLLTEGQEVVPLILDDPFVQYDEDRLQSGMVYLGALSRTRQVILMTCHQRTAAAARALGLPVTLIRLPGGPMAAAR